ncbi:MAG: glycerate kinase [Bacilli bacterium]|nr:glycerate kinase [Bacilli bacterium]
MNEKNIVIASDSFKGTLSSLDICLLFEKEIENRRGFSLTFLPLADGGEGSLDTIAMIKKGHFVGIEVNNLYFEKCKAHFYVDEDNNAYIECASCAGFSLAKEDNNPGLVTTYGLGEQIKAAIELGIKNIYMFIGGSATNDGGVGLASALGTKFYNKNNKSFVPTGLTLKDINYIDNRSTEELLTNVSITILSDVKSPLFGIEGAAYKFAPQKGATKEEVELLDKGLRHLSDVIIKDLGKDVSSIHGSGAAGGLGGGLLAFANAKMSSGIETILDLIHFDEFIAHNDLVISGEGKLDRQTLDGKVIDGIAKRCMKMNKPLYLIVGISELSLEEIQSIYPCVQKIFETNDRHIPFEEVKGRAKEDYQRKIKELIYNL